MPLHIDRTTVQTQQSRGEHVLDVTARTRTSTGPDAAQTQDDASPVLRVECSQDGQLWRGAFPVDGIADSKSEHYEVAIDGLLGMRGLTLRATDSMNNIATAQVDAPRATGR